MAVLVSLGLNSGDTTVAVNEANLPSPGSPVLLTVTILGDRINDTPIRIVPVTYNEFKTMLSSSLLDQLFPSRPINAASGKTIMPLLLEAIS